MIFQIPEVLKPDQVAQIRKGLEKASWADGRATAGQQAARVKDNTEAPKDQAAIQEAGATILAALTQNKLFAMAALPQRISQPQFNRYQPGQSYGLHVDNAIRPAAGAGLMRSDLSATLFLSAPDEYDGGELTMEDTFGVHDVKLPAGHLVLYPASSLHQVKPVTKGVRLASFFWIHSMIRDDGERTLLLDLDVAIQQIHQRNPGDPAASQLVGVYNNLLRRWAEV